MELIFIIIGVSILLMAIAGAVCYRIFAVPNMRALSEADYEICLQIVKEGKGYPFMCRHAVRTGKCACQPCDKLNRAKERLQAVFSQGDSATF